MKARLVAVLRLLRAPNMLTAMVDVAAGALVGAAISPVPVAVAAFGSAALYGGAIALNDLVDVEKDRRHRPSRPLPAGAVPLSAARFLALALLTAGLLSGFVGDTDHRFTTASLVLAIVAYDVLKDRSALLAVILMGACRGLNLLRGGTLAPEPGIPAPVIAAAAVLFALVSLVTLVSRGEEAAEEGGDAAASGRGPQILLALAYFGPLLVALVSTREPDAALYMERTASLHPSVCGVLSALLAYFVVRPGWRRRAHPGSIVKRAVFTLVLFDALLVFAAGRWSWILLALVQPLVFAFASLLAQRES